MSALHIYHGGLKVKQLKHVSVAECAIQTWREGVPSGETLGFVDYMGVPDVATAHSRLTNVARNMLLTSVDKVVHVTDLTENSWTEDASTSAEECFIDE